MNQYYLSEWLSGTNAAELPVHIYTIPLSMEENRHSMGGKVCYGLSKQNQFQTMVFFDQYIASFKAITNWQGYHCLHYENRPIKLAASYERTLLERLIKKELEQRSRLTHVIDRGAFRLKQSKPMNAAELLIYPAIQMNIEVQVNGDIIAGFDYVHRLEYKENVQAYMTDQKINMTGRSVVDTTHARTYEYEFVEVAPYKAGEVSPYLKESVIDYYIRKKEERKLNGVSNQSPVIHVKNREGAIFPYLPHLLKLSCSFDSLPSHLSKAASKTIKMKPHEKMTELYKEAYRLLRKLPMITFPQDNIRAVKLGYEVGYASPPLLQFGNKVTNKKVTEGLSKGGVYKGGNVHVSFFVDPLLQQNPTARKNIGQFIQLLIQQSAKLGVNLIVSDKPRALRGQLSPQLLTSEEFPYQLKSISRYFDGTVIVIASQQTIDQVYRLIKKEFGGKQDMITQFVTYTEQLIDITKSFYLIQNLLLGIFVKSGKQPWVLGDSLHSDCFIGLDVSHESGNHACGMIQTISRDGTLIQQKSLSMPETGEKIHSATIEELLYDTIHFYQEHYKEPPRHITFHRDGFCREDLAFIERQLAKANIAFDYVEILKNVNRRMAVYHQERWTTEQSLYYRKNNVAYLCSTSPKEYVGMAKVMKIVQKTNHLPFDHIISDVYKLSFMHIHSMLKTRLPITIHYADLSSTFHNRDMLHPATQHTKSLPFV
ncbi:hypothetical protein JOC78_002778 [Bacillus ectoiniformans]|uniref:Piwi domain-containing protein n=1 Tax=Bacillus ectoiniformans TaxID=1494429 RepID=UPI00195C18B0|nr:Piwi domain-containing protein [Bacillus ectoiniformans]MBM7649794.1 hypothetical protein [Bacillus ectoiniformans]